MYRSNVIKYVINGIYVTKLQNLNISLTEHDHVWAIKLFIEDGAMVVTIFSGVEQCSKSYMKSRFFQQHNERSE